MPRALETSRNTLRAKQGMNEDDSRSDPHSKAFVCQNQPREDSGPIEPCDNAFGWKKNVLENLLDCKILEGNILSFIALSVK